MGLHGGTEGTSPHGRRAALTLLLSGLVPCTGGLWLHRYCDCRWVQEPLHALIEASGATLALLLAGLLLSVRRGDREPGHLTRAACALISMGVLGAFHATARVDNSFVWLRALATLIGGAFFASTWRTERPGDRRAGTLLPAIVALGTTLLGVHALAWPRSIPALIEHGEFTALADLINALGGLLFLVAATRFALGYRQSGLRRDLVLANHCLLFAMSGLLFVSSSVWNPEWWLWHLVCMVAYAVVLPLVFVEQAQLQQVLRESEEHLQRARKLEAMARMAGWLAHDFGNILAIVSAQTYQARRRLAADHPAAVELQGIDEVAQRGGQLTAQLRAFSQRQALQSRVLDLNAAVRELGRLLPSMLGPGPEVVVEVAPGGLYVRSAPGQIDQIVLNLAINARDAMPAGGRLRLRTAPAEAAPTTGPSAEGSRPIPRALLEVEDSGCGMDEATLGRVFEPFFTTKPQGKGTGLGLAIVYALVQQMSGQILVDSAVGRGTVIRILLPCVEVPAETAQDGRPALAPMT